MAQNAQRFDSRQSMKNHSFEIFHYQDRKLENIGIHYHDFYEVYFFIGGNVDFLVGGRTYTLEPGDLVLINPQELHQARVTSGAPYERMVLWIDRNYLLSLQGEERFLSACFVPDSPSHINVLKPGPLHKPLLQDLLENLSSEFYSTRPGSTLYARGLLLQFLVELNRLADRTSAAQSEEPELISRVLHYIGAHFQENITLESLSSEFFVSKYHLSHEFSRRVGTSVYRYILFRRLTQARELMEQGGNPGTVYQSCGFRDYANFYRAFRLQYGISPSRFLASLREKH